MKADSRSNLRFAVVGLAATAAFVAYQMLVDLQSPRSPNPPVMIAFVILCPPSLLSILFTNVEAGTNAFYYLWAVIGILNGALYAGVRATCVRVAIAVRRKKSD